MVRKIRPQKSSTSSGPWEDLAEMDPGRLTILGPNGTPIYVRAKARDTVSGLESPYSSPPILLTPTAPGGGGGGNPSPRVTWAEPTRFNTGPTNPGILTPLTKWRHETETVIRDFIAPGGLRIGGAPRTVLIENFVVEESLGEGGNNLNSNQYGITTDPSFSGGTVIVRNGLCGKAYSANIFMRHASWVIEGVQFWDAGADHIKSDGSITGSCRIERCFFGLMANSYWNRNYNDPSHAHHLNLSYVHGDAGQFEDVPHGMQIDLVGNVYDLIGTYSTANAPVPPYPGWPIAAYSAAAFFVPRNIDFVGTALNPPVNLEGNWIMGCTIPVRIGKPGEGTISHWRIKDNIWRPEMEFAPTQLVAGGTGEVTGNIWEPTGQNCDAWILSASGATP